MRAVQAELEDNDQSAERLDALRAALKRHTVTDSRYMELMHELAGSIQDIDATLAGIRENDSPSVTIQEPVNNNPSSKNERTIIFNVGEDSPIVTLQEPDDTSVSSEDEGASVNWIWGS